MSELRGEKITLVKIDPRTHAENVRRWLTDPLVTRFFPAPPILNEIASGVLPLRHHEHFAVLDLRNTHIGIIGIEPLDEKNGVGEGYFFIGDRRFWGRGYVSEALALAIRYAFTALGYRRIEATCFAENRAMLAHLNAACFVLEGLKRKRIFRNDRWQDILLYALLAEDYSPCAMM